MINREDVAREYDDEQFGFEERDSVPSAPIQCVHDRWKDQCVQCSREAAAPTASVPTLEEEHPVVAFAEELKRAIWDDMANFNGRRAIADWIEVKAAAFVRQRRKG